MTDPRRYWDKQLEDDLPDCRLSWRHREDNMTRIGRLEFEKVFCANCGGPGGAVTPQFLAHIFFLCDNCARENGDPPGARRLSEEEEASLRGVR